MNYFFLICLIFSSLFSYSQNVGIGTNTPHSSSALEIKDSTRGILIPRMTMVQRNSIQNPAEGLMVYQKDSIKGFWYYDGTQWKNHQSGNVNGNNTSNQLPVNLVDTINNPTGAYIGQFGVYNHNGNLYYWNGYVWIKIMNANCPAPTVSYAGSNFTPLNYEIINLQGNTPTIGFGRWSIINGTGGILSDSSNPNSQFIGLPNSNYTLRWSTSTNCQTSFSDITINYLPSIQYNQSGSWQMPYGVDSVRIEIFGGGGAGGAVSAPYTYGSWYKGAGGGAGGYGSFVITRNQNASIQFNVGFGGNNNNNGDSTFCLNYYSSGGFSAQNGGVGGTSNCPIFQNGGNGLGGSAGRQDYYPYGPRGSAGNGIMNIGSGGDGGQLCYGSNSCGNGSPGASGNGAVIITPLN